MAHHFTQQQYAALLRDPRWIALRERKLNSVNDDGEGPRCFRCGSHSYFDVHHLWYKQGAAPWEYGILDLMVLCRECHGYLHTVERQARAFVISLDPLEADHFGQLMDAIRETPRPDWLRAIASAARACKTQRDRSRL